MKPYRVCLIEDDPIMGESVSDRFALEGFDVEWYDRGDKALDALKASRYAAVISDVRLPDVSGVDIFRMASETLPLTPPFVFITAFASVEGAVAVLKLGASDYVTKPFDIGELVAKVRHLVGAHPADSGEAGPDVLGVSASMRSLAAAAPRIAQRARTVLITGASGSGKEVVAHYLHSLAPPSSAAQESPFVAVNCGAIPENLLEDAFFGHERGAFTGADRTKKGHFEQAHAGTLFLDEIGDLPLGMQVKLLRAIQERRVQRLGSEEPIAVDVRVYCATHQDLRSMVAEGAFREDLYYRINVVHLKVPALRDRPDDVLWLAQRFLEEQSERLGEAAKVLTPGAQAALLAHDWPGNARELRNRIEHACVLTSHKSLAARDLFEDVAIGEVADPGLGMPSLEQFVADAEKTYIAAVLARVEGRIGAAAGMMGISRKTLWEKMKRLGLHASDPELH